MKLILPYLGRPQEADVRLAKIAEFAGIATQAVELTPGSTGPLADVLPADTGCLVLNPRVIRQWTGLNPIPPRLMDGLLSRAPFVLVHGVEPGAFDAELVRLISQGALQSVEPAHGPCQVSPRTENFCEAFSGLSIGPAIIGNDSVFTQGVTDSGLNTLISFGGHPFLATLRRPQGTILFLGSADAADLQAETTDAALPAYFSRFVAYVMALRHAFGKQCWLPAERHAAIVIDDPLLKKRHGFLEFEALRAMAHMHRFHAVIAFIPHNFRRSSSRIARMFKENRAALSLCFHGNDHTGSEFASKDAPLLNTMIAVAQERMATHEKRTGLHCEQVMIFPQGRFSVEAMSVLKASNFLAAVNTTPHPYGQPIRLTLAELSQPAVLRYGGFPLFLRKPIGETRDFDVAFCLMFGRPVLIVEHHELFENTEPLAEIAKTINSFAPDIAWSNLASVVRGSYLKREEPGVREIRAYAMTVDVTNSSETGESVTITWPHGGQGFPVEGAWDGDVRLQNCEVSPAGVRLAAGLPPQSVHAISLRHTNTLPPASGLGFKRWAQAVARRRLSEWRDNYLSPNPRALAIAKGIRSRLRPGA